MGGQQKGGGRWVQREARRVVEYFVVLWQRLQQGSKLQLRRSHTHMLPFSRTPLTLFSRSLSLSLSLSTLLSHSLLCSPSLQLFPLHSSGRTLVATLMLCHAKNQQMLNQCQSSAQSQAANRLAYTL